MSFVNGMLSIFKMIESSDLCACQTAWPPNSLTLSLSLSHSHFLPSSPSSCLCEIFAAVRPRVQLRPLWSSASLLAFGLLCWLAIWKDSSRLVARICASRCLLDRLGCCLLRDYQFLWCANTLYKHVPSPPLSPSRCLPVCSRWYRNCVWTMPKHM